MSAILTDRVRVLIAPCGCIAGVDISDTVPGFCRSKSEAAQDIRDGFTEQTLTPEAYRESLPLTCEHSPKWGRS